MTDAGPVEANSTGPAFIGAGRPQTISGRSVGLIGTGSVEEPVR
jgi:hypothetical protein